jgi:hypothetical protein
MEELDARTPRGLRTPTRAVADYSDRSAAESRSHRMSKRPDGVEPDKVLEQAELFATESAP